MKDEDGRMKGDQVDASPPFQNLRILAVTFVLAFVAAGCGLRAERRSVPPEVESAVGSVSDDLVAERYEKIYSEASELWRQDATLEQTTTSFKTLREKLGPVENRVLQSATEQTNSGGALKGRAYILMYRTKFQRGEGMETFTLAERKGQWLLARYLVTSTELR